MSNSTKLPKNAIAKIGQTSLLGSQHIELLAPPNPSSELLSDGCIGSDGKKGPCTIPKKNSSAYPTTEQTLASLSLVLRGGGIPNLETLQDEVYNVLSGRGEQIHAFLGKLDTFTRQLNEQRDDITHAIDSTNRLLIYVGCPERRPGAGADRRPAADQAFRRHSEPAHQRCRFDRTAEPGHRDQYLSEAQGPLHTDLQSLQCPLGNSAEPRRI